MWSTYQVVNYMLRNLFLGVKLRDYQSDFKQDVHSEWGNYRSILGVMPTGAGKTVVFTSLMAEEAGPCAAIVHRRELVRQISKALARLGVQHRVLASTKEISLIRKSHLKLFGKSFVNPSAAAGVASVQTLSGASVLKRRDVVDWLNSLTLAIFDEGHHYTQQGHWATAVKIVGNARLLFLTATPERADGKGLGVHADGFAEILVEGPTPKWLMEQGYLCKYTYKAPKTDLSLADIPLTATGDLNTRAMRKRIVESHLVGDVVKHYQTYAAGKQTIVFANDVKTAEETQAAFLQKGIKAAAVSGETEHSLREKTIEAFETGELTVLINVDLFDEGFDVAGVEAVILARATESLAKFLQMIGRALRVVYAEGFDLETTSGRLAAIAASKKPKAIVIDAVRNWERGHGMPDWPRTWTLDRSAATGAAKREGLVPQRVCLECTTPYERVLSCCPLCGEEPPPPDGRKSPEQVDGDLFDLDVDALSGLFDKQQQADMPDDEYRKSLVTKGVPYIGQSRLMRLHKAAKYRRSVLRNLVGWWVGMQRGRELSEIHKRFYYRFGVDIGTAFTLGIKETDALIDKIKKRFNEDIIC